MRAMTEIEWLDGRVTKVPELALGDAFGESVQAELDFGFDNVLEGLWVEVRHHEPDEDSDGDPRGRGCALYADCRYSLVEPSDLDRVFCILYEGQPRVCRVAGELVNLSRACALSCLMLGSPCPPGALEALAACARYLCGPAFTSDLAARARAAGELGPPCVGTSFRASTASGLWHSPPGPPVPPGRRVSRLWQDDCTYICAFPVWEYVSAYAARGYTRSALHRYTATRLRGHTPPPDERREGRPWAPSGHAPIFERGAVGASRKPSASAGPISKLGFAAGNPRPETRDPICIPADALRNRKKSGTGVRVRGNPCRICVTEKTG